MPARIILLLNVLLTLNFNNRVFAGLDDENKSDRVWLNCDRECVAGEEPRKCKFEFSVELFNTLSKACHDCPKNVSDCFRPHCITGDGVERVLTSINRQMPGPPVVVCQGDTLIVDVINHMPTEAFSIHWHGEHMRDGYQYMDGGPHVTQCPINPGAKFRYTFLAATPGTHFYHSHLAFQRGDGAFGAYIVKDRKDPSAHLYDMDLAEHIIFAQEWFHMSTRDAFVLHHWDTGKNKADNLLINGRGLNLANASASPPATVFNVRQGVRYRFRVVSPGFTLCPIRVSVDQHKLTVIASDGGHIEPISVGSLIIHPGERYDFVLNANQTSSSSYAMRFVGLFDCAKLEARSAAIVKYDRSNEAAANSNKQPSKETNHEEDMITVKSLISESYQDYLDKADEGGPVLNALNYAPPTEEQDNKPNWIPITRAKSTLGKADDTKNQTDNSGSYEMEFQRRPALSKPKADKVFYMGYDLYPRDNPRFHHAEHYSFKEVVGGNKLRTPQMNNITLRYTTPPLLSQPDDVDQSVICSGLTQEYIEYCGEKEFCSCLYILEIDLNDTVEIVLIDEGFPYDVSHPFHMHGNDFYVVSMERHVKDPENIGAKGAEGNSILRQTVMDMDKQGLIKRNLIDPPRKDTVSVPDGGFTIIRFLADNPGFWLMHCHMSWHNELGMGFVLKVGDVKKDVPPPPKGFPTCKDFE